MATIVLYANKVNQMLELVQGIKSAVNDYKTELQILQIKALSVGEWMKAVNDYQRDSKYQIIFLDDDGNNMFPRELTQKEKIRNWMKNHIFYFYLGEIVLLWLIFLFTFLVHYV